MKSIRDSKFEFSSVSRNLLSLILVLNLFAVSAYAYSYQSELKSEIHTELLAQEEVDSANKVLSFQSYFCASDYLTSSPFFLYNSIALDQVHQWLVEVYLLAIQKQFLVPNYNFFPHQKNPQKENDDEWRAMS